MTADFQRAFEFLAVGDIRGARRERSRFGTAVFDHDLHLRHDSNYLLVEIDDVNADELEAEAGRLERPAILVPNAQLGERLAPDFGARGWLVHRGLVMAQRRAPERAVDAAPVDEVDERELRPARRQLLATEPWATPELVEQLLDAKLAIGRSVETCFFAVHVDGVVAAYTDLYLDGRTGQVEDVATLPAFRRRGYASALVAHAVVEARRAGCDFVFLVSDAEDWPQQLYRQLGFDDVGRYVKFFRP